MKKKLLFTLLLTGLLASKSFSQNESHTVKINPLSALLRIGSVFYEHKLSDKGSIQLGLAYTGIKFDDTKFSGLMVTPEYRFYPKENALNGLYLAPYLRYQNFKVTSNEDKGSYNSFGGGAVLGRQWIYKSGFTLDLFFGPSFNSGNYKAESGDGEVDFKGGIDGFGIRTGILIGFGF